MRCFIFIVVCLFIMPSLAPAQAESNLVSPEKGHIKVQEHQEQSVLGLSEINEKTVIKDLYADKYQTSSIQNISTLYWLKGVLDLNDQAAIDNFLLINECDYYKKNIEDDFKWQKVREAAKRMIADQVKDYSDKYQIIVPIDLGRYDHEKKGFPLTDETKFNNLRRVQIGGDRGDICGNDWIIENYPREIRLILNKPFNFNFLYLDEHVAQAFILRYRKGLTKRPSTMKYNKFDRIVFARVRITLSKYQKIEQRRNDTPVAVFFGSIDGFEIFENSDETGLLYSENFIKKVAPDLKLESQKAPDQEIKDVVE